MTHRSELRSRTALEPNFRGSREGRSEWQILWIDDEIQRDDALLSLMELEGFRVDVAASAAEGLERVHGYPYEAILVDLRLPDMFGLTVVQRLIASGVHVPVIVITGYYHEPELQAKAKWAGAAAFLHKPLIGTTELLTVLRRVMMQPAMGPSRLPAVGGQYHSPIEANKPDILERRVREVIRIVQSEYGKQLSIGDLAARVGLSASRLRHLFHEAVTISLTRFVRDTRLDAAAAMLLRTDKRVSEICYHVGFSHPAQLDHAFRHRFGVSPRQYRVTGRPRA